MQQHGPANGESQGPFFLLFLHPQSTAWAYLAQGIDLPRTHQGSFCHLLAGRAGVGLVQLGQEQPSLANLHSKDLLCSGKYPQGLYCRHVISLQHGMPCAMHWQQAAGSMLFAALPIRCDEPL